VVLGFSFVIPCSCPLPCCPSFRCPSKDEEFVSFSGGNSFLPALDCVSARLVNEVRSVSQRRRQHVKHIVNLGDQLVRQRNFQWGGISGEQPLFLIGRNLFPLSMPYTSSCDGQLRIGG
jgi:hypothetical protein